MKLIQLIFVSVLCVFAPTVIADCQYWDGTAPFCEGSCPSNCRTVSTSNSGNGASCWSGHKALCDCCPGPGACTPTETDTACYGLVLVCKNIEHVFGPTGDQNITCSTFACGLCFGFGSFLKEPNTLSPTPPKTLPWSSIHHDVMVRGRNTSEQDIENALIANFGPKLTPEEMRNVTVVRTTQPDMALIKGNAGH